MAGLRINFILPDLFFGGGARTVLEHAVNLRRFGHEAVVHIPQHSFPDLRHPVHDLYARVRAYRDRRDFSWYGRDLVRVVPSIDDRFIRDGDIVIATWWRTAFWVHRLSPSKGIKVHFIQGDERVIDPEAVQAWRLPLAKVTVAHWLQESLLHLLQAPVYGPVMNAVNRDLFFQTPVTSERERTVGVQFSTQEGKGFGAAREAFRIVRKERPEIQFVAFGQRLFPRIPPFLHFYYKPRQEELRTIYSRCAVWLVPSTNDSMSLIPLEAASCGCALVATETGEMHRYFKDGESFAQVSKGDAVGMAHTILELLGNREKRESFARAAGENVKDLSWEKSSRNFERVLLDLQ